MSVPVCVEGTNIKRTNAPGFSVKSALPATVSFSVTSVIVWRNLARVYSVPFTSTYPRMIFAASANRIEPEKLT